MTEDSILIALRLPDLGSTRRTLCLCADVLHAWQRHGVGQRSRRLSRADDHDGSPGNSPEIRIETPLSSFSGSNQGERKC